MRAENVGMMMKVLEQMKNNNQVKEKFSLFIEKKPAAVKRESAPQKRRLKMA